MDSITSLQNEQIKKLVKLHQRKGREETGTFLIEGEHLVAEALKQDIVLHLYTDQPGLFSFEPCTQVTEGILLKLSQSVSGSHVVAVCKYFKPEVQDPKRILLLDSIQDPGNLGTLIRSSVSFGFDAIYCSEDTVDFYNEKVIRSTQGALFEIPIFRCILKDIIQSYQKEGFVILGTALKNAEPMETTKAHEKMGILLGNEGNGVQKELLEQCDRVVKIDMQGFESLNVAVAGGILLHQYRKENR